MSTKHKPGPWRVCNHSWCETSILAPDFDHAICCLDINHATEESQEADEAQMAAHAALIAAAPEMLEFAQWVLSLQTGGVIQARASAVIAKATN